MKEKQKVKREKEIEEIKDWNRELLYFSLNPIESDYGEWNRELWHHQFNKG